jgi:hypothetical protein
MIRLIRITATGKCRPKAERPESVLLFPLLLLLAPEMEFHRQAVKHRRRTSGAITYHHWSMVWYASKAMGKHAPARKVGPYCG